ncbi:hypothetical protein POVCU2_0029840 [Plasmodium ovale curtisi]|uniref:Uncharacterized protein n=1 Tax=Plasmodium ovale curtisi TaxID=864141 RepID=A0A1A8VZK1_PLAOA|nr:hypothetical protein POVCU2_0029840 [Plasmodium ovale curtisi]SBS93952.1 hypothetical protein POVCU1_027140 [Plasmodium ovale curtisi]
MFLLRTKFEPGDFLDDGAAHVSTLCPHHIAFFIGVNIATNVARLYTEAVQKASGRHAKPHHTTPNALSDGKWFPFSS